MSMKTTPYEEKNEDRMEQFKLVMQDMQKATQKAESQVKKGLYAISGANIDEHAQVVRYLNKQPFTDDEIKEAFFTFDMNGNGNIGAAEIRFVLDALGEEVTEEEIDEMIRLLDADGDGQVGYPEFYKMASGQSLAPLGAALQIPKEIQD